MPHSVMVVDDSETDLLLTRLTLEQAGVADRLLLMSSVAQALACLARPGEAVDLVLLDVNMPGEDGFDFLRQYGQTGAVLAPVVMLSASPDPEDRRRALAHACVRDFLSKPLDAAKADGLRAHLPP